MLQQKDKTIKKKLVATISWLMLIGFFFCAQPLFAVTWEDDIPTEDDDGFEYGHNGQVTLGGSQNKIYANSSPTSSDYRYGGFRWTNVTVPKGATIDVAYIRLYADDAAQEDINVNIHFQDSDNPGTFVSGTGSYDISNETNRPRTLNYTTWAALLDAPNWYNSPSLVDEVQEIVDRSGWSSGNAMAAIFFSKCSMPPRISHSGTPASKSSTRHSKERFIKVWYLPSAW
jgi:hypothetical protein